MKTLQERWPFLLFLIVVLWGCQPPESEVFPDQLRCEHLLKPYHLDIPQPRLSWQLRTEDPKARNIRQTAYRILVSSSEQKLRRNRGDIWDSGQVSSDQSILIRYEGAPLESRRNYFWKVRIWDQDGQPTKWSAIATWRTALLHSGDWAGAQWIGHENDRRDTLATRRPFQTARMDRPEPRISYPAPLLRRTFTLDKPLRSAYAYVSALGYGELYVNGHKVSDHVLDPAPTSYDKTALYVTHNLTGFLQPGENALGIWLGNGFFGQNIAFSADLDYGQPRVMAKIFLTYEDGAMDTIVTDTAWKTAQSPVIFDNVYGGETYDARREIAGWSEPGFDDRDWFWAVRLRTPGNDTKRRSQMMPPIRVTQRLAPKEITHLENGDYLVDFGQNIAGWVKLTVREAEGAAVTIRTAEALRNDGRGINNESTGHFATGLKQVYTYLCKGEQTETWEPRFSYHGFRYAQVSGLSAAPTVETIEAALVHTDISRQGTFSCSDERLNRIYETSLWTIVDNLHGLPEDCPHREKCGWLGDAHAVAETCLYNFDMNQFYAKYLQDIRDNLIRDRRIREQLPHLDGVPTMVAPGKRTGGVAKLDWGAALILLPWYVYRHTGDLELFRRHYPAMIEFVDYMYSFQSENGIIENGLGDWCPPRWDRYTAPEYMECHPHISANAYFYQALTILSAAANLLGDAKYSWWTNGQAEQLRQAFNRAYLQPIPGTKLRHYGSQTATVMALQLGLVPDSLRTEVLQALVYDIEELHDGHHSCGIHGLRYLYSVLAENGEEALAYRMLTDPTFPSPTYIINAGLTTWPERQWEWQELPEWERSLNHPMQAGFTAFLHESILGIQPDTGRPGYQNMLLHPYLTDQLEWAEGSIESPYGTIFSAWKHTDRGLEWQIEIPPNTQARVQFPGAENKQVWLDGELLNEVSSQAQVEKKTLSEYSFKSGKYDFLITPK